MDCEGLSLDDLWALCLEGDQAAASHLVTRLFPFVERVVCSVLFRRVNDGYVDEVVSDVFDQIARNMASCTYRGPVRAMLNTIIRSRCIDERRRVGRRPRLLGDVIRVDEEGDRRAPELRDPHVREPGDRVSLLQAALRQAPRIADLLTAQDVAIRRSLIGNGLDRFRPDQRQAKRRLVEKLFVVWTRVCSEVRPVDDHYPHSASGDEKTEHVKELLTYMLQEGLLNQGLFQ